MKFALISLGCSKNTVDSELILSILEKNGYERTEDPAQADILLVNTCGFIEPAKQESIDVLFEMAEYKEQGRCRLLVACGCLAQRYEQALMSDMPEVDLVVGVSEYAELPKLLTEALNGKRQSRCGAPKGVLTGERTLLTAPYSAYIRIADGCDNRCAYCAIPLIRGDFRSRTIEDVLNEIQTLAKRGVREFTLIAQDTSRFGIDLCGRSLLPELMEQAAEISGVEWLRVLYTYPDEIDGELLRVMASHENICRYLDLPLQHADPELLHRMNRRGDPDQTRALLHQAREMGFILRTTFITGFPGETEEQFEHLLDFVKEIRFDRLGAFAFSPEEDTPAAEMPDQIPEEVRQERLERLMLMQQEISLERNQIRLGSVVRVLVDGVDEEGCVFGRSYAEAPEDIDGGIRLLNGRKDQIGTFVKARIVTADIYDLEAEIVEE